MSVLVARRAPDFTAAAVMGDDSLVADFNLYRYIAGRHAIVFFYPMDFTFVCPTEIIAFNHRLQAFRARHTLVVSVSGDSEYTHLAWRKTPVAQGGVGPLGFPMVADTTRAISRAYDVLLDDAVALRATFLLDRQAIVRHQLVNDLPLGRNVDEALRMVDALQFHEEHGEVCPAGWQKGETGIQANAQSLSEYLAQHSQSL
ncbi:MAG: peroxiredoxin [Betaproteobacteria bacterium]|nr:peroxiredoxin [Betaproteobacteria bacterium]